MQEEGVKYAHKIMDRRKRFQSQSQTLTEINQEAAFDEELYEVFPDGTVRVREKVIQFIRYLGSLQARQAGTAIKTTACPMANLKRE